jgi:hypothetical protein
MKFRDFLWTIDRSGKTRVSIRFYGDDYDFIGKRVPQFYDYNRLFDNCQIVTTEKDSCGDIRVTVSK